MHHANSRLRDDLFFYENISQSLYARVTRGPNYAGGYAKFGVANNHENSCAREMRVPV